MVTEILALPLSQATASLALSDPAHFEEIVPALLDALNSPSITADQALHLVGVLKSVGRRVAFYPNLGLRLSQALLGLGDAGAAATISRHTLEGAGNDPEIAAALATVALQASIAAGEDSQERRKQLRAFLPVNRPTHMVAHAGPIRIGFLSARFPSAAQHYHPADAIAHLGHADFQLYAYATELASGDGPALAGRLGLADHHMRTLAGQSPDDMIQAIRADAIDFLIDLDHSSDPVIAAILRARPAQATILWLQSAVSNESQDHDFIFAAEDLIPDTESIWFRATILSLPNRFNTTDQAFTAAPLPQPTEQVNFAVLSRPEFISGQCLQIWAALLSALPAARLVCVLPPPHLHASAAILLDRMGQAGLPLDRVAVRFATDDLATDLAGLDIALDSFPCNELDGCYRALLAGLPVITLKGSAPGARTGALLLTQISMGALVTSDPTAYAELAGAIAYQGPAERASFSEIVRLGAIEAASQPITRFVERFRENILNIYAALTEFDNPDIARRIAFLSSSNEEVFRITLRRLMLDAFSPNSPSLKFRALKILTNLPERVVKYHLDATNLIVSLVSVSDYETSGDIGYRILQSDLPEFFRRTIRHETLFCLSAGTDIDSRRVNELALAKGKQELLPGLKPRRRPQPAAGRRLRIGYLFSFFLNLSYSVHTRPVFDLYNQDEFEVFAYGVGPGDTNQETLCSAVKLPLDHVRALGGLSGQDAADAIRQDNIDILVELDGFSRGRRDDIFLHRPAAINALWYNTPYTLGIDLYDFVIADAIVLSPEERSLYSEEIVDMPHSVYSWMTQGDLPPVADAPCGKNGYITFGSFNRMDKLSMLCLESWAEILRRVPTARLLLHYPTLARDDIRLWQVDRMERAGLPMDRVMLRGGSAEHLDWATFMASYGEVDIGLDPYPYCGGHTSYDTVCMGVPLVCFPGPRYPSRISVSIVTACDVPDFVAPDRDGYIDMAVRLAQETPEQLTARRHDIRRRVLASPFRRWPDFVRALEGHYRTMVDRAQAWPDQP